MKNFKKFAKHLEDSISGVFLGAQIFHKKGYTVKVNPSLLAPSSEEWENYADNGDLEVSMRVEVKQSGYDFTSSEETEKENVEIIIIIIILFKRANIFSFILRSNFF